MKGERSRPRHERGLPLARMPLPATRTAPDQAAAGQHPAASSRPERPIGQVPAPSSQASDHLPA
ncbi:hypothetical protein CKO45_03115 [Paracraurococcus ruber]|uniref:Uncharacterized protein n=1 Tax=Paracraurococcus ruber TaxID=77675 RepID=A0ABS1CS70_9PROT|nr:hypothetical protein [Paracraurococcus ruber]